MINNDGYNEGYKGINDALNTDFEFDETGLEVGDEETPSEHQQIVDTEKSENTEVIGHLSVEDEDYITTELKKNVEGLDDVMNTLSQDIIIGASAKLHEVYALLATSRTKALTELTKLKLTRKVSSQNDRKLDISEARVMSKRLGGNIVVDDDDGGGSNDTIAISPNQLADIMEKTRKAVEERQKHVPAEPPEIYVEADYIESDGTEEITDESKSDIPIIESVKIPEPSMDIPIIETAPLVIETLTPPESFVIENAEED